MTISKISAVLIVSNEAHNLRACIDTLHFCSEIIVVEHGSADGSAELARDLGCRVVQTADWPGFGVQKQRALDLAVGDWIFSIDADERVSDKLAKAIVQAVGVENASNGYRVLRETFFLGKAMRHGGWYPDSVVRLARRGYCHFDPALVHEKLVVEGDIAQLTGHLLHYSYPSIDQVLEKQCRYALLGAKERARHGKRYGISHSIAKSVWTFVRHYIFQLGMLDGRPGFLAPTVKAQETFWKCAATRYVSRD